MQIRRYQDLQELSREAARSILELALERVGERGIFTIVLSGGNTPRMLYEQLAQFPYPEKMPWNRTHLFWGDERCVAPDHPDSNYHMAYEALIAKVDIPAENVHRIPAEMPPPHDAALAYECIMRDFFSQLSCPVQDGVFPSFDLVLLGLGGDGHTASLFPGDPVLEGKERWVAAVNAPDYMSPRERITLTLPVINRASCVLFLVSGSGKKEILDTIHNDPQNASRIYPAALVQPAGQLIWYTDIM